MSNGVTVAVGIKVTGVNVGGGVIVKVGGSVNVGSVTCSCVGGITVSVNVGMPVGVSVNVGVADGVCVAVGMTVSVRVLGTGVKVAVLAVAQAMGEPSVGFFGCSSSSLALKLQPARTPLNIAILSAIHHLCLINILMLQLPSVLSATL